MTPEQHELLKKIAAFPLESQNTLKRDDDLIYGFNEWRLTVADVKQARAMLDAAASVSSQFVGEREAIENIQQALSEAILRFTDCLERQDWRPSRSHIEGARNTMAKAVKALDAVDTMLTQWALPAENASGAKSDEIVQLKETIEDLSSTMDAWFDLSKKTADDIAPILIDGLKGYLRTAKNGGMSTKAAATAEAILVDYCRLYAGHALLPVLRDLVSAPGAEPGEPVSRDLVNRCQELLDWRQTGLLHKGAGGSLRAYAERLAATGIGEHYALSVAESNTGSEAMKELVRLASARALLSIEPSTKSLPTEKSRVESDVEKITKIIDQAVGDGEFIGRNQADKAHRDAVIAVRSKAAMAALFPQEIATNQPAQAALKRLSDGCRIKAELYEKLDPTVPASFIWIADEIDAIVAGRKSALTHPADSRPLSSVSSGTVTERTADGASTLATADQPSADRLVYLIVGVDQDGDANWDICLKLPDAAERKVEMDETSHEPNKVYEIRIGDDLIVQEVPKDDLDATLQPGHPAP